MVGRRTVRRRCVHGGLPLRAILHGPGKFLDVVARITKRAQHPVVRELNRIVEGLFPAHDGLTCRTAGHRSCSEREFELVLISPFHNLHMFKGIATALFAFGFLVQLDQYLYLGRHTEAAVRMLLEIERSFGF